jgi:integrase
VQRVHGVLARILDGAVKARRLRELDDLLAASGAWAPALRCLGLTAMRVGEMAELRVRDLDLKRSRAKVSRSMTTLAPLGRWLGASKNNKKT